MANIQQAARTAGYALAFTAATIGCRTQSHALSDIEESPDTVIKRPLDLDAELPPLIKPESSSPQILTPEDKAPIDAELESLREFHSNMHETIRRSWEEVQKAFEPDPKIQKEIQQNLRDLRAGLEDMERDILADDGSDPEYTKELLECYNTTKEFLETFDPDYESEDSATQDNQ